MSLTRSRVAVAAAFLTQGFVFITLTSRLPVVQDIWDLGELGLSMVLLVVVLLSGTGSVVAERLARDLDSATLLRTGLAVIAVAVPVVVLAPVFGVFVAGMAAYGVALGIVDATTNMQAVALEHRYERPLLPSFHGMWTLGGILGAGLALATGGLPFWTTALAAVVPAVVMWGPFLRREPGVVEVVDATAVPWRPIIFVGIALVLFYMVDTAAATWGPTYLHDVFAAPAGLVALATFPYLVSSGLVRLSGDALVARFGPRPVLSVGAVLASGALAVVVFAPTWPVAVIGFGLLGAGTAVIAPLSFSAAAHIAGGDLDPAARHQRVDQVIARFNQFNYLGALLGAVLTGVVGASNLRFGFAVPMVLILGILPLARYFDP